MIEPTENPSLFKEDEIPKKLPKQPVRRKTIKASKEPVDQEVDAPSKAKPAARAPRAKAAKAVEPEAKPIKAPRAVKAAKAPVAAAVPTPTTPTTATRKRVAKKTEEEVAPVIPTPPVRAEVPAPAPAEAPVKKPRGRAPKASTQAPTPQAPGPVAPAEEWKPGAAARPVIEAEPAKPAPVVPVKPPQPEAAKSAESAQVQPQPSVPAPQPARPFAYEHREGGGGRELREGREPREGGREHREHREQRGHRHGRDRDFRGRRDFRENREQREQRENREPRESGESREQRIAAARQEFATQAPQEPIQEVPRPEPVFAEGIVEVSGKGFGFLRDAKRNFSQHPNDIFVTPEVCRRFTLRDGMWIRGEIRRGNRGSQMHRLTSIEGEDPEKFRVIPLFEELTTINPNRFVKLETVPERYTTRVIDMMAPIGRGQRGLIVAPPRTGKTTLLQHIAEAVITNHPDMKLIILLVDERPEEVTEIRRTVPSAEIMASSNDMDLKSHTRIAQLAIERAKRLVEMGKNVFVLLDSITRVGRAFNNAMSGGGRTMSGGVDARALEIPRKLFAAARNTEEAGSLTIIATALIETGSRMDDLIFQEFKGTGNMELVLDRKVSDLRIYPAVDIFQSGTRREELLLPEADLHKINIIRRGLAGHKPAEAIERLLSFLKRFPTNAQMLREIPG